MGASEVLRDIVAAVARVLERAREEEVSFMAASILFFGFVSLVPLLILALAIASVLGGDVFEERLLVSLAAYLSPEGRALVVEALTNTTGRAGASLLGVGALLWSAFRVFQAVDVAFDRIYDAERSTPVLRRLANAAVVFTVMSVGFALVVGVGVVTSLLMEVVPSAALVVSTASVLATALLFLPFYYVMPPSKVSFRHTLPGVSTAVVGWHLLQTLFGLYASAAGRYQAYGLFGAVLLFLLWMYFAAVMLLLGAVVNVVVDV